jgi:hypothetical protein
MIIPKWTNLIQLVDISGDHAGQELWSEGDFLRFKAETGLVLPRDYKDFCSSLGSGIFGDYIKIYCPNLRYSEFMKEVIRDEIRRFPVENIREVIIDEITGLPTVSDIAEPLDIVSTLSLLDHAFVFGDNADAEVAMWDLRTYSPSDQNCDIYFARTEDFNGDIYRVGRDFYEFICDFCLGEKSYKVLPEWMHPFRENIKPTFQRFKPITDNKM